MKKWLCIKHEGELKTVLVNQVTCSNLLVSVYCPSELSGYYLESFIIIMERDAPEEEWINNTPYYMRGK